MQKKKKQPRPCSQCGKKITVGKKCSTCRSKAWREKHPIEYSYKNLRNRARQRKTAFFPNGIPFEISLAYFKKFCYRTKYIQKKGKSSEGFSVDRKNEELGYVEGNIRAIPLGDNVRKYHKTKRCTWSGYHPDKGHLFVAATETELTEEEKYF
jgi:hypothetical protein